MTDGRRNSTRSQDHAGAAGGGAGVRLNDQLGPLPEAAQPIAYLYHDAARAEDANPLWHSTLVVMAADRRPHCRNETALYALTPEDVAAVNAARKERAYKALRRPDLCQCDHNQYCRHCHPLEFRAGGVWGGPNVRAEPETTA